MWPADDCPFTRLVWYPGDFCVIGRRTASVEAGIQGDDMEFKEGRSPTPCQAELGGSGATARSVSQTPAQKLLEALAEQNLVLHSTVGASSRDACYNASRQHSAPARECPHRAHEIVLCPSGRFFRGTGVLCSCGFFIICVATGAHRSWPGQGQGLVSSWTSWPG